MPGNVNTGFGYFTFGHAPFGSVNWAQEHFKLTPERIREEDLEIAEGNYQKFIDSIAPLFNEAVDRSDDFVDLIDPDSIPIGLLPFLARNFGIELEQILSDASQRSFVRNAVKWMALKGTEMGYKIRANLSGFDVTVLPLYRLSASVPALVAIGAQFEIPPGSGNYYTYIQPEVAFYDEVPSDIIPTDIFSFEFEGELPEGAFWRDATDCTWCKSYKMRVEISENDLDLQDGVTLGQALQSIVEKLDDVTPAHVELAQVAFTINLGVSIGVGATIETFGAATSNEPVGV